MDKTLEIKNKVTEILANNGIEVNEDGMVNIEELSSLMFVSMITEVETEYEISIPDEYLTVDTIAKIDNFVDIISFQLTQKAEEAQ